MSKTLIQVKDKKKLKTNVTNINTYLSKMANELKSLSDNLNKMMIGDKKTPYWNGEDANDFYNVGIRNLRNDIADYTTAKSELDELGELYELVNAGYKK